MDVSHINWLAAVVAGLSAFVVGGIWYSKPLFGNAWMTDSNLTDEQIKAGNKGKIFGFTAIFSLLMAANLPLFLSGAQTDLHRGLAIGFHTGIFAFCAIATHSLFELRSWRHILINGFYSVAALTLMGAIIGCWR
jgi:hypothetical protein